MKPFAKTGIMKTFIAGLVALLPVVLTFVIMKWLVLKIAYLIGPASPLGSTLQNTISFVTGNNHQLISYFMGLFLAIILIIVLGVIVQARLKYSFGPFIDRLLIGTPVIGNIYKPVSQVVRLLGNNEDPELKSMTVVSCKYAGVDCLGLLTSNKIYTVDGQPRNMVFLPQAPIPMTGNLALVPSESIHTMPDMTVEELLQTFVSLGLVSKGNTETK
ncbi:MAG: DUF502 domain-containing protein [Hellea sp.]|nr:DUF502 domain-containing protein [Hyphomonadaceae bacterium]NNE57796.1 DUF502 domain-containing protein [Hellea sp.]